MLNQTSHQESATWLACVVRLYYHLFITWPLSSAGHLHRPIFLRGVAETAIFEIEWCSAADKDDYTALYHPRDRFSSIQTIRKMLSGLITVSGIPDHRDEVPYDQNGTVSFSHFTVKQYLEDENVKPSKFRTEGTTAHWYIMHSCLTYLKCYDNLYGRLQDFSEDLQIRPGKFDMTQDEADSDSSSVFDISELEHSHAGKVDFAPFLLLLYAAKNWREHGIAFCKSGLQGVEGKAPSAIEGYKGQVVRLTIKIALSKSNSSIGQEPSAALGQDNHPSHELSSILPDSFRDLQDEIPAMESNFDFEDSRALSSASNMGELELVRLLVIGGADIKMEDKHEFRPLVRAIESGSEAVVSFLLARGARLDYSYLPRESH
ncbi:hypothetical protein DER46DRAFT_570671 [Fusarium sp. MPI-SDFR-AT-0072]|nr:hypothetical protein DER46DRAFT_570671 [Fusarium sp. MPI-SDFR-AT-0072]